MYNRMLDGTVPVSGWLLSPRASKAAPDATRQDAGNGGDTLTPSPASSLKQALTWQRRTGAEASRGERCPSAAHHPTRSSRGTWSWEDTEPEPTSPTERPESERVAGAALLRTRWGGGWLGERPVLPERAWQQRKRMFPKEDQSDTAPGRWAGAIPEDPCPRSLPFAYFSVGVEGAGTGGQSGVGPPSPGTSGMWPKRRLYNTQNICLMRAGAGVWASATQRCLMPFYNDSAPNRPVTFLYLPRAPLNPEPESKTGTQTQGQTSNPGSPGLHCVWLRAAGEEKLWETRCVCVTEM